MSVFSTLVQWVRTHQSPRSQNLRRSVHTGRVVLLSLVKLSLAAVAKPG